MEQSDWLRDFHAGNAGILEQIYRENFAAVVQLTARLLSRADAETVTHEVFFRLLSNADVREKYAGGNFQAWLRQVATNAARDHLRRYRHELAEEDMENGSPESGAAQVSPAAEVEAKVLIDRFRKERLPPQWAGVFEVRFLRQLPQRDAARELGMQRTTLVYQEQRIRALLREFLLGEQPS